VPCFACLRLLIFGKDINTECDHELARPSGAWNKI
jgi:hypothetical protein